MADQPQREKETNCREEEDCMSGQLQGEEETNCRRGEEGCMSGQPQREEETNCRGEESCASTPRLLGRRTALCSRRANCRRLTGQW